MIPKQAVDCFFELYGIRYPGADSLLGYLEEKGFAIVPMVATREMAAVGATVGEVHPWDVDDAWTRMIEVRPR